MNKFQETHAVTGKVRLIHCNLASPRVSKASGEPRYSVTLLIPKDDLETKALLDQAMEAAILDGVIRLWNGRPEKIQLPLWDGDEVQVWDSLPTARQPQEQYKGHWVLKAMSRRQPQVVDANLKPLSDASSLYSGIYGRVSVDFFPFANGERRGLLCGLVNVQKLADGERMGGRPNAREDFRAASEMMEAQAL